MYVKILILQPQWAIVIQRHLSFCPIGYGVQFCYPQVQERHPKNLKGSNGGPLR